MIVIIIVSINDMNWEIKKMKYHYSFTELVEKAKHLMRIEPTIIRHVLNHCATPTTKIATNNLSQLEHQSYRDGTLLSVFINNTLLNMDSKKSPAPGKIQTFDLWIKR